MEIRGAGTGRMPRDHRFVCGLWLRGREGVVRAGGSDFLSCLISWALLAAPRPEASRHHWHLLSLPRTRDPRPEGQESVAESPLFHVLMHPFGDAFYLLPWKVLARLGPLAPRGHHLTLCPALAFLLPLPPGTNPQVHVCSLVLVSGQARQSAHGSSSGSVASRALSGVAPVSLHTGSCP